MGRGPLEGAASKEYAGREENGELPAKYAGFVADVTEALRVERYSYRTEQSYVDGVRRFLIFAQPRVREEIRCWQVKEYLNYLTLKRRVFASTVNQALSALQIMCRGVLRLGAQKLGDVRRAPSSQRVPTVLSREEVMLLLGKLGVSVEWH